MEENMNKVMISMGMVFGMACGAKATHPRSSAMRVPEAQTTTLSSEGEANIDRFLHLEEVDSEPALAWVREENKRSEEALTTLPSFNLLKTRLRSILDSDQKIPMLTKRGNRYYNFWKDASHPKGLLRRTTLAEYKKTNPNWEPVLDVDALAAREHEPWVYKGSECLPPQLTRCLISLSRGGADAVVVREFDLRTKRFISGGFELPEAKTDVHWKDINTLFVATNFGEGTLTESGYPRIVKEWKRGTALEAATTLFEGKKEDIAVLGARAFTANKRHDFIEVAPTFFTSDLYYFTQGKYQKLSKPLDATVKFFGDAFLFELRSDWEISRLSKTYKAGALVMAPIADVLSDAFDPVILFEPNAHNALLGYTTLKSKVIVNELLDVKSSLFVFSKDTRGGWIRTPLMTDAEGTHNVEAVEDDRSDDYWHTVSSFGAPNQYGMGHLSSSGMHSLERLKSEPSFFDADVEVTQQFAASKDGTQVPYFVVKNKKSSLEHPPVLLYGYGGFEVALTPSYNALMGAAWLEKGGVYVLANIRGGGEYGPLWHQAAMREKRQHAYDDFIAVAEHLISTGVTTKERLGIQGGSNGGLLMGVMMTQRPDLFGAVVCQVPLLDMKRYHLLLAGASWMEEYGDPDVATDWESLSRFSPYQNVRPGVQYPPTLFTSSTRDDRVHPGHGRKMVAKLRWIDTSKTFSNDIYYFENMEGGHGGAANNEQKAHMSALAYTFLWRQLDRH